MKSIIKISMLLGCLFFLLGNGDAVQAHINNRQIAIGGMTPGCNAAYTEKIYGKPLQETVVQADTGEKFIEYNYGGKLVVGFTAKNGQACYISCTANNLKTPAGIAAGMRADCLTRAYGKVDRYYTYKNKTLYIYNDRGGHTLSFDVKNFYIIRVNIRTLR